MKYAGRTARRLRGARKGKTMEDILKELEQEEIAEYKQELRRYLDEIPDFLAWDVSTEYRRMKLEFENREDA